MREIKFRAWDKELGMCQVLLIDFNNKEMEIVCLCGRVHIKVINIKNLMQFTGLKDKNGKDVYEGDVVNIIHEQTTHCHFRHIGYIKYLQCNFAIRKYKSDIDKRDEHFNIWLGSPHIDEIEVIGNIYENKELLNV